MNAKMREFQINGAFHTKCVLDHGQNERKQNKQKHAKQVKTQIVFFSIDANEDNDDDEDDDKENSPKIRQ